MRRIRPEPSSRVRGVTLVEMIIAMVIVGIVVAATIFFANPIQQAIDVTTRAELTDIADNALQRIGRDVRLALSNSVRTNGTAVEFIPLRTGGRYRAEPGGACATASDDHLAFGVADGCFKSIGAITNDSSVTANDFLVLNNYGDGFTNQDAYAGGNRRPILAPIAAQQKVTYDPQGTAFDRNLHDSPGRRFYVVTTPVAYLCDLTARRITRYAGYGFHAALNSSNFGSGTSSLIASNVTGCNFDYSANVAPMVGLLTLRLTLSKATTTGTETVTLYHSVHVNNVP
ncbi:MAG TPA: prepilin-type N-terminal cleavage/methylation domain-containing protein [Casimicrobiaceae bacterium]|jgi:MSHA biogenesis protein MshO|nr:prepilin-type N-terminal cleavage/methylation domain-containing protein [Casimicrobiaceae bacterium]